MFSQIRRRATAPVLIGLALCASLERANANNYYVSPTGKDNNSGSAAAPWKTIGKVNSFDFAPGDRVSFLGGATFAGNLYLDSSDAGTSANPVVVTSYGTGAATIDAGSGFGLYAYNAAGIEIRNLVFHGSGAASNHGDGVFFYMDLGGGVKLDHLVLEGLDVSGFGKTGLQIGSWNASKSGYRDVTVSNTVSHDNVIAGMAVWGYFSSGATGWSHSNFTVRDCEFAGNSGDASITNNHTGDGVYLSDVDGARIEYCSAHDNGWLCANPNGGPVGIWAFDANAVTIQRCESHHNRTGPSSLDGGGFDLDGGTTHSIVQYNYSHDNQGPGVLLAQYSGARAFHDNTIRYNVSQNDGRAHNVGAITLWNGNGSNGIHDCQIHNNTIYVGPAPGSTACAVKFQSAVSSVFLRNNVFVTAGGAPLVSSSMKPGATFQQNDWYSSGATFTIQWNGSTYHTLAAWRTATGQEKLAGRATGASVDPMLAAPGAGGTIGDPHLLSTLVAYEIAPQSLLIDKGIDLLAMFGVDPGSSDFYGGVSPWGARLDIGANEWNGP
jgi:hypothetical protein